MNEDTVNDLYIKLTWSKKGEKKQQQKNMGNKFLM